MSTHVTPVTEHGAVTIDGNARTFTVLGARSTAASRGLVLVFHGSKQSGAAHRRFTGDALAPLAVQERAVVVYLDGYRGNWNDARRQSSFPARRRGMDDVAFTRAVIEQVSATHRTDPGRVILVGYSNGGQMVLRLLHQAPEIAAAAVVIAATMPAPENFLPIASAGPAIPTPITLVHGTLDRIVPFSGGSMSRWAQAVFKVGGRTLSASDSAAYFAARNGMRADPVRDAVAPESGAPSRTAVVMTSYRQDGLPPVALYEVRGGGHTVPGPHAAPRFLGRTATAVTLLDLVIDALADTDPRRRADTSPAS
jgi:polyhydroxybutyrate depolymerase